MRGTQDILGHRGVIQRLWSAAARDQLHHAFLFEGPVGVGKRTLALRLAMACNCEETGDDLPCGRCDTCRQIAAGNHPDVLILEPPPDRASGTIPVDAVREVVRLAGYHRYNSKRRFVIVDPAEAMQPSAANALLKTLEEPPDGTGFILIASNPRSLLPTIRSRCQRVRFQAVSDDVIEAWLESLGKSDAHSAARMALGCPGQALSLAEGEISVRRDLRESLLTVLSQNTTDWFAYSKKLASGDRQKWVPRVELLLEIMESLLRDVVIVASERDAALLNGEVAKDVRRWTAALWPDGVTRCAAAIQTTRQQLALNVFGNLALDALLATFVYELGDARYR